MIFREPADVKGTMFLSWEYGAPDRDDDKWLYMPAVKKDRRISGTSRNEYFMGSDFPKKFASHYPPHELRHQDGRAGEKTFKGQIDDFADLSFRNLLFPGQMSAIYK